LECWNSGGMERWKKGIMEWGHYSIVPSFRFCATA
jgi:hypothetical protein